VDEYKPLYHGAMPFMFNATIVNGMGLTGWLEAAPQWVPGSGHASHLDVRFAFSEMLWPW
jgi:membrane-bound transcription factor site-1 protease